MAHDDRSSRGRARARFPRRGGGAALALATLALCASAGAQTLASKAKESGCVDAPRVVEGRTYRCSTSSGAAAYFNVPGADAAPPAAKRAPGGNESASPPPAGFPKVDAGTQRSRDEMRRKVLGDELASEEKLLVEARAAYANGAPAALPDERADPQKYSERIAKLRQAVQLHERNIEALRKELGQPR